MYTIILVTLIFLAISIFLSIEERDDVVGGGIRGIFASIMGFAIGTVIATLISLGNKADYNKVVTHELVSVNDGSGTQASFMLGSGYVKDKLVYTYYRKSGDGGMVRRQISSNLTTIYESDTICNPLLEVHIVTDEDIPEYGWSLAPHNIGYQKYKLFLPKGLVIREIKLDNE